MSVTESRAHPSRPGADAAGTEDNRWWLVAGAGLLIFMAQFDTFVVTTALPTMQADLGFSSGTAQWVLLGFLLPLIAVSLPAGRWLDRVGGRPALTFAVAGFAVTSLGAGLAPGLGWLIAARAGQGVFAALMIAQAFSLATVAVQPAARGRSMAVVATLGSLGAVSGPTVGGYLTQAAGWPWIFYVNLPIGLLLIAMSWAQAPAGGPLRPPHRDALWEFATLGAAAATLMLSLSLSAGRGLAWLLLTVLAVPFVAAWSRIPASREVIALVRRPGMAALHVVMLTVFAGLLSVQFVVPFHLHRTLHASAGTTGLVLLALPAAQVVVGPVGGILTDRWGARPTALAGIGVMIAGTALLVPLDPSWTTSDLAWRLGMIGVALGLSLGASQTLAMSQSPPGLLSTTSASINLARQLGIALGPALATLLWAGSGFAVGGMRVALGLAVGLAVLAAIMLGSVARAGAGHGARP